MKYNARYRKSSTVNSRHVALGPCPTDDPTPMTVGGTRAQVERYYSMKRMGVGAGGSRSGWGTTTLVSPGPKKTKTNFNSGISTTRKKTKSVSKDRVNDLGDFGFNWVYDFDGPWRCS